MMHDAWFSILCLVYDIWCMPQASDCRRLISDLGTYCYGREKPRVYDTPAETAAGAPVAGRSLAACEDAACVGAMRQRAEMAWCGGAGSGVGLKEALILYKNALRVSGGKDVKCIVAPLPQVCGLAVLSKEM